MFFTKNLGHLWVKEKIKQVHFDAHFPKFLTAQNLQIQE